VSAEVVHPHIGADCRTCGRLTGRRHDDMSTLDEKGSHGRPAADHCPATALGTSGPGAPERRPRGRGDRRLRRRSAAPLHRRCAGRRGGAAPALCPAGRRAFLRRPRALAELEWCAIGRVARWWARCRPPSGIGPAVVAWRNWPGPWRRTTSTGVTRRRRPTPWSPGCGAAASTGSSRTSTRSTAPPSGSPVRWDSPRRPRWSTVRSAG
jgi:hypothetical protein